jgi:hypothetical protein
MAEINDKRISPQPAPQSPEPIAPTALPAGTVHVPGAEPSTGFRPGSVRAPDAGFKPRMARGVFGVDPASREIEIPGVGRMTVGQALTRLAPDELPNFSENPALMAEALSAARA